MKQEIARVCPNCYTIFKQKRWNKECPWCGNDLGMKMVRKGFKNNLVIRKSF
jgi:ssDNA-binding Zn-finger/Zn-ribbon topoisomerase 1